MTRLLHAAARGARLQVMADNNWYGITQIYMPFRRDARAIRIHPDDAHLQYGPISTALREMAANPNAAMTHTNEFGTWSLLYSDWCNCCYTSGGETPLFLLILSECLADEGL